MTNWRLTYKRLKNKYDKIPLDKLLFEIFDDVIKEESYNHAILVYLKRRFKEEMKNEMMKE